MGRSAMMTGARTCVKTLNPAVSQTTLPYGMTRMGLNPAEERQGERDEERAAERQERGIRPIRQTEGGRVFISEKCAHVIQFNTFNPTGLCVATRSLHSSCNRQQKLHPSTLQFNLGPYFLGNEIFDVPLPCGRYDTV